ncbi:LORELEI-LIKE-GPI-ANCHORED PROTEIN 1 [Prunus dulcis]|uniref:LORELEI-LIKE-GPI-ANCHORED PROTEIN 1 n=1 Tax=Prunus dulcis TaxID=3755 RepID=A0A4Y1RJR1_PRUDU|nr:LORELEI-LIKE-GPI-ANCHORED PROTEIN 1 [Prunus dulcis]
MGGIFESQASIGRNLLQAKKGCPVNFEFLNYTVITSRCKGPQYPAAQCCDAFKELACPYTDVLNDLTNECASIMFSYITSMETTHRGFLPMSAMKGRKVFYALHYHHQRRLTM